MGLKVDCPRRQQYLAFVDIAKAYPLIYQVDWRRDIDNKPYPVLLKHNPKKGWIVWDSLAPWPPERDRVD